MDRRFPCQKCYYEFDSEDKFNFHLSGIEHNIVIKDDFDYVDSSDEDEEYSDNCRLCKTVCLQPMRLLITPRQGGIIYFISWDPDIQDNYFA